MSVPENSLDIVETAIVLPFVLVQVSMVAFLLIQGRKEKSFRQAFYVIFVSVTVVDCVIVIAERLDLHVKIYFHDARLVLSDSFLSIFLQRLMTALDHVAYPTKHYQPLCHTILALNRFTVFAFPAKHTRIWTRRTVLGFIVTIATVSLLLGGIPSVFFGVEYAYFIPPEMEMDHVGWEIDTWGMTSVFRAVNLLICCFVSFVLNISTVAMFLKYRLSGANQMQQGQDVRLFVHSLFMLVVQSYLALQQFIAATDNYGSFAMFGLPAPTWVPSWLMLWSQGWLAGDADCERRPEFVRPKKGPKYCGTMYMILTGEFVLTGDLTTASLAEYLFALSGAPFLLIISGVVRSAYLSFYFNCVTRRKSTVTLVVASSQAVSSSTSRHPPSTNSTVLHA